MIIEEKEYWYYYYQSEECKIKDTKKSGKWMYFYDKNTLPFVMKICELAIKNNIVESAKCYNGKEKSPYGKTDDNCVACFYLDYNDIVRHKKVINFFIENNLIPKTKSGKYWNISYKLDEQTRNNEYDTAFIAKINLSNFIDLTTGEFLQNIDIKI